MSAAALPSRTVGYSAIRDQVYMIFPNDLNHVDTVFGGLILSQMDRLCAVAANRHAGGACVTVGLDAVQFLLPARRGDVLFFHASVIRAWNTSMEIGCRVEAAAYDGLDKRHILSVYFTFIAVDDRGRPRPVAQIAPADDTERRRFHEAQLRREQRLRAADELKEFRADRRP